MEERRSISSAPSEFEVKPWPKTIRNPYTALSAERIRIRSIGSLPGRVLTFAMNVYTCA
jgi:hypothetical protein